MSAAVWRYSTRVAVVSPAPITRMAQVRFAKPQLDLTGDVMAHQLGEPVRIVGGREDVLALLPQALVDVARRTGKIGVPFGHERDRQVVLESDLLHRRLEERRLVGGTQAIVVADRHFADAGPRFGVQR